MNDDGNKDDTFMHGTSASPYRMRKHNLVNVIVNRNEVKTRAPRKSNKPV
jgi:hypothetical protein